MYLADFSLTTEGIHNHPFIKKEVQDVGGRSAFTGIATGTQPPVTVSRIVDVTLRFSSKVVECLGRSANFNREGEFSEEGKLEGEKVPMRTR
jgi:hypothetical protein